MKFKKGDIVFRTDRFIINDIFVIKKEKVEYAVCVKISPTPLEESAKVEYYIKTEDLELVNNDRVE